MAHEVVLAEDREGSPKSSNFNRGRIGREEGAPTVAADVTEGDTNVELRELAGSQGDAQVDERIKALDIVPVGDRLPSGVWLRLSPMRPSGSTDGRGSPHDPARQ